MRRTTRNGQSLDTELKKVRKTVDYLAANTNVICVVNTTGTPYFQRQPLKDVVIWYGLSEGIRDGILKDLAGNIQAYDFSGDASAYVAHVIEDFFRDYGDVRLPNGAPAKLAVYFPQTDDLRELRPIIDRTLAKIGLSPALCLVNTSDDALTKQGDIEAFNRLNDPAAPHRVMLLVNKGTEGWNCPSLFACALARKLKTSNNFVLQATTRCLRQVPGNAVKARVYLSADNFNVLDRQLQETYGETIQDLNRTAQESRHAQIVLRKLNLPPLVVTQLVRSVVRGDTVGKPLRLNRPTTATGAALQKVEYTVATQQATRSVLQQVGESVVIESEPATIGVYAAAADLAARYLLNIWTVYDELRREYGNEDVPLSDLGAIATQVEQPTRVYEVREEKVEVALALVKAEGFTREPDLSGAEVYTAEIVYPVDREQLLLWSSKPTTPLTSKARTSPWSSPSGSSRARPSPMLTRTM
jgi:type III restriction enzyme